MKSQLIKNHSKANARSVHEFKRCDKDFHSFQLLREHKWKEHAAQRCSRAQNIDVTQLLEDVDDNILKEKLKTCIYFLVDSEMKNGRHRVFNFVKVTTDTKYVLEKLDVVFDSLKCSAYLNVAFSFALKNVGDEGCRYSCAHEINTSLERAKLLAKKEDLTKIKNLLSNSNVFESCTRERANTKRNFHKLTIVTNFAALLKEVPMRCEKTLYPDPLLKNSFFKCLTLEEDI